MLSHWLIHSLKIHPVTRDRFGATVYGTAVETNGRFREIDSFTNVSNREQADSDAICWLKPSETVSMGDVIEFEGEFYRIDRFNRARRGGFTGVEFKKCELRRQKQIS